MGTKNDYDHGAQFNLVSIISMKEAIAEMINPLKEEIQQLRLAVQGNNQNISIKEFSEKAGLSIPTIRGMMQRGQIQFNQAGDKKKVTIPITELLKTKQI